MLARDEGQAIDAAEVEARVEVAVREAVQRQRDTGIDVLNDGEMSKPSYSTYVKDRLSGFEGKGRRPTGGTQEAVDFPGFARATDPSQSRLQFPVCTGRSPWPTLRPWSATSPACRRRLGPVQATFS